MASEATVIVAAFGGGLLGAVAQPLVAWIVQRRDREADRLDRRNTELRQMIEERLKDARKEMTSVFWIYGKLKTGYDAFEVMTEANSRRIAEMQMLQTPWRPFRIEDDRLREMCEELNRLSLKVFSVATDPRNMTDASEFLSDFQSEQSDLRRQWKRVMDLQDIIVKRMDELKW